MSKTHLEFYHAHGISPVHYVVGDTQQHFAVSYTHLTLPTTPYV